MQNITQAHKLMDKNTFLTLLVRPTESTQQECADIANELKKYPYCAPLQLLAITSRKVWQPDLADKQQIAVASLYVGDRAILNNNLAKASAYEQTSNGYDILKEINDYQEPSIKATPKKEILSTLVGIDGLPNHDSELDVDDQDYTAPTKKNISDENTLMTETLAIVYEKQGKIAKAIEVYEKLSEKYPEKSSTFANRIAVLQAQL